MSNTLHTRRKFLRTSVLGAAASWTLPVFLEKTFFALDALAADAMTQATSGRDNNILVVLQLAGGNDGLNSVVPFVDDAYHRVRPKLALPPDKILKLDSEIGLNPRLTGLKSLYDSGQLAIVQGVGYPNPNRSHSVRRKSGKLLRMQTGERTKVGSAVISVIVAAGGNRRGECR